MLEKKRVTELATISTHVQYKKRSKILKESNKEETKIMEMEKDEKTWNSIDKITLDVEFAQTKNMGNFESLKIGIRVSRPTTWDQREEAYNEACEWIQNKISAEYSEIMRAKNFEDPFSD